MKKCNNGHDQTKDNIYVDKNGKKDCRICIRKRSNKWKKNNPDKVNLMMTNWRKKNRNKTRKYEFTFYAKNPSVIKERRLSYNKDWEDKRMRYRRWSSEEDRMVLDFNGTKRDLSKILERSVQAIGTRRSLLKNKLLPKK